KLHFNLDDSGVVHTIQRLLALETRTLFWIAVGLAAYAIIELVEGVGLWYARRWAEYLTVVATAAFLPLEIYELTEKITWLRVGALIFNIAAVVYLLVAKRLFGLRGGLGIHLPVRHLLRLDLQRRRAVHLVHPGPQRRQRDRLDLARRPGLPPAAQLPRPAHPAAVPVDRGDHFIDALAPGGDGLED